LKPGLNLAQYIKSCSVFHCGSINLIKDMTLKNFLLIPNIIWCSTKRFHGI